jgi:hypothetical protein
MDKTNCIGFNLIVGIVIELEVLVRLVCYQLTILGGVHCCYR